MSAIRIDSVSEPFASEPELAAEAAWVVFAAEYMGALPDSAEPQELGAMLEQVFDRLSEHGVAQVARNRLVHASTVADYRAILKGAREQIEHSPMPDGEWQPVIRSLSEDLLASLLGVSASSLRRYAAGDRMTPDAVAARLHFLALLLADLSGGYNDYGIRRWFERPRTALNGQTPADLLGTGFDPDGVDAARLRELAAGLLAAGAT